MQDILIKNQLTIKIEEKKDSFAIYSNPRVTHLSNKSIEMLQTLPKNYGDRVFSFQHMRIDNYAVNFQRQHRKVANK